LRSLEAICSIINTIGSRALIYLAAAVSDFYIEEEDMQTHKIQTEGLEGDLVLTLKVVPKMLDRLVHQLVPKAFVVSFKLETDDSVLIKKARKALERYGHQVVIGNLLTTRKSRVVFVYPGVEQVEPMEMKEEELAKELEIESMIIDRLKMKHEAFMSQR